MFTCKICGEEMSTMRKFSYHIRLKHNITKKEYYDNYILDDKENTICPYCNKQKSFSERKFKYIETCGSKSCASKYTNLLSIEKYGISHGKRSNLIFQENTGLKSTWQLEKTKESIKNTLMDRYGYDSPQKCPEIFEKTMKTRIEKYGDTKMFGTKSFQKEYEKNCLDKYGTTNGGGIPESIDKIKKSIYKNYGHHTSWACSEPYIYDNISFDSSWEVAYYIYHKENGYNIKRSELFFPFEFDGKIHNYYPDFEIDNKIVEIKGTHFFKYNKMIDPYKKTEYWNNFAEAKHQCMLSNNIEIITDCKLYITYVENKYGKNYIKQFKKKYKKCQK